MENHVETFISSRQKTKKKKNNYKLQKIPLPTHGKTRESAGNNYKLQKISTLAEKHTKTCTPSKPEERKQL